MHSKRHLQAKVSDDDQTTTQFNGRCEFVDWRKDASPRVQAIAIRRRDSIQRRALGSITRSTHGNREFADLSPLLCSNHNHHFGSLCRWKKVRICANAQLKFGSVTKTNAGGKRDAHAMPDWKYDVKWVEPGTWARKVSTCSRLDVRLGMDGIPIGVMREKGVPTLLAACMMMAEQWELSWVCGWTAVSAVAATGKSRKAR